MTTTATGRFLEALRSHGLEPQPQADGWLCCCPAHDDHDPSLSIHAAADGKVLITCFTGCTPDQIVRALSLELADLFPPRDGRHQRNGPARIIPAVDWAALHESCREAFAGGMRDELAEVLGLAGEALDAVGYGWSDEYGAWTCPERDGSGRIIGMSLRSRDGSKWQVPGSRRGLIIPDTFPGSTGPLFIPEGASDVAAMTALGLTAVGRPSNTGGVEHLATLLRNWPPDRPIIIVGENDAKPDGNWPGRDGAIGVAKQLAARVSRPISSALPPDGTKDVRAWHQAEPDAAIAGRLVATSTPTAAAPDNPLPLLYYVDVKPVLSTADFVERLLIDGGLSVVYGESGCGKTYFALDLALRVADGAPWRDRHVERRGVLYLALEGSHGIRNRIAAWRDYHKVQSLPLAVVPTQVNLLDPSADVDRVLDAAKTAGAKLEVPVGFVVVDTVSRAISGGNENSSDDMGALVRNLDLIRQEVPAHVQGVHHSGKDTAKGARGHSLLRAATDTEIEVSRDPTGVSTARVMKQRDLPCEGEFQFRLEPVELGTDRRLKPVTSCVVVEVDPGPPGPPQPTLNPYEQTVLGILARLVEDQGSRGFDGTGPEVLSVPLEWWRERVYHRTKPGDKQDTKRRAFKRASDTLINAGRVLVSGDRVWVP
jgi:phage/plasmid primase-like uncharacterized protein